MIRFHIEKGSESITTPWIEEPVKAGTAGHTAVAEMIKLREQHGPEAKIRIERTTPLKDPHRQRFRYNIFVPEAWMKVIDAKGEHSVHIVNTTLQSRPFQEAEREKILTELNEKFPQGKLTEVRL